MQWLSRSRLVGRVGLDLGSDKTRIWNDRDGLVLDQPSCLAVDQRSQRVLAVGDEAQAMEGRVGSHIKVHYPIRRGVVYDADLAQALVKAFLHEGSWLSSFFNPLMLVSAPAGCTQAERDGLVQLAYSLGASEVYTITEPLAASIGAGVPIADASGSFFLHLGAGRVEGSVVSLGSLVDFESTDKAGLALLRSIRRSFQQDQQLIISQETARWILQEVCQVVVDNGQASFARTKSGQGEAGNKQLVAGQDLIEGSPKEILIQASDLHAVVLQAANRYKLLLEKLLSRIPPELTVDVIGKGLLLSGGLAQLKGLGGYLTKKIGAPVAVVDKPDQAVIDGLAVVLENIKLFKESLGYR